LADATCVTPSTTGIVINSQQVIVEPTTTSVVQPTCALPSGSIAIVMQIGAEYSLDGITYQSSTAFSGLLPGMYTLYVRSTVDNSCMSFSLTTVTIGVIPTPPTPPVLASIIQPTCSVPSGTISITVQSGVEYSLDGINYQVSEIFTGLAPKTYTLYVRNSSDNSCTSQSVLDYMIDMLPILPSIPTVTLVTQPRCDVPSGTIVISQQTDVQYSVGNGFQDSNVFSNLASGQYTISVRFKNSVACVSVGSVQTINPIPPQIQFETIGDCENKVYTLTANPISNSYDPNNVSYQWKDKDGSPVGTNSNVLNVSDLISSSIGEVVFPLEYSLAIVSTDTGCNATGDAIIASIYCDIQKGISPDGNGSNDFFDLRLMDVKKLGVFNRYGIKVYEQSNYTDQWKGQTDDGQELPSATYYYVIEFNNGESKTGWIYLIREK
jgi:gliding motility-associated-like protein